MLCLKLLFYGNNINNNTRKGTIMTFLRWLGGFVVLFWLIGLLFKIGGNLINILLVAAAVIFIADALFHKRK